VCLAATYYVDATNGNDLNDGLSPETAWKTIGEVNNMSFSPGDSILFKRSQIWREQLIVPSSGNSTYLITFGAYGTGEKPIINGKGIITGSDEASNWNNYNGNIWYMDIGTRKVYRVWLNNNEYGEALNLNDIDSVSRWYSNEQAERLYVYATTNPATFYTKIERAYYKSTALTISGKNNIIIRDLDLRGGYHTVYLKYNENVIIENNNIGKDCGHVAMTITYGSKNGIIRNNVIDSGYRIMNNYETVKGAFEAVRMINGAQYFEVYNNTIKNWHHGGISFVSSRADFPTIYNKAYVNYITAPDISYGRAFATMANEIGLCSYNEFYGNYIFNTSVRNQIGGDNNQIYYNIIDTMWNSPAKSYGTAQGISLEQVYSGEGVCFNNKIFNNVIYNTEEPGIRISSFNKDNKVVGNEIINNIMINTGINSKYTGEENVGLLIHTKTFDNKIKNNIIYSAGISDVVKYKNSKITIQQFNSQSQDGDVISGNSQQNPEFVNLGNDFRLKEGSPAIDAGIDVGLSEDFEGNSVPEGSAPDIGAYEYTPSTPSTFILGDVDGDGRITAYDAVLAARYAIGLIVMPMMLVPPKNLVQWEYEIQNR